MAADWVADEGLSFAEKMKKFAQLSPSSTVGPLIELEEDIFGDLHDIDPAERTWHGALAGSCICCPERTETEDGQVVWVHDRANKEFE